MVPIKSAAALRAEAARMREFVWTVTDPECLTVSSHQCSIVIEQRRCSRVGRQNELGRKSWPLTGKEKRPC